MRQRRPTGVAGPGLDTELEDLPAELRWREWILRVEAVIFAATEPVTRAMLAKVVGKSCNLDLVIAELREALRDRPYELAAVAGGFQYRTRTPYADAIRVATGQGESVDRLSPNENLVLLAIAYFQPITRAEIGQILGKEVSRDLIGGLRGRGLIGPGPRSPTPGAPLTLVTTSQFLSRFGFDSLRELPDMEALEEAGLLSKHRVLAGDLPLPSRLSDEESGAPAPDDVDMDASAQADEAAGL